MMIRACELVSDLEVSEDNLVGSCMDIAQAVALALAI